MNGWSEARERENQDNMTNAERWFSHVVLVEPMLGQHDLENNLVLNSKSLKTVHVISPSDSSSSNLT